MHEPKGNSDNMKIKKIFYSTLVAALHANGRIGVSNYGKLSSLYICLIVLLLTACGGRGKTSSAAPHEHNLPLHHARFLRIDTTETYTVARITNPWDTTRLLHTYLMVDSSQEVPHPLPAHLADATVVRTPLHRSLVYSSIHIALLQQWQALSAVAGVADLSYIQLPAVTQACREGRIADVGSSISPQIEKVIALNPDAILLSPFENSGGYGAVDKLGVPIIECADYMEASPLGRAEWMRFYGRLYGKAAEADSLFAHIEQQYNELKQLATQTTHRPLVMSELKSSSAWYVPGGRSAIARFYADAGARYAFATDSHYGSVPLSFETVFGAASQADFWLIKYNLPTDKTYADLAADYAPYRGFRPFSERHIYCCNTHYVSYYEETPFAPHLLLKDFIHIFHPEVLDGYEGRYYRKLKE